MMKPLVPPGESTGMNKELPGLLDDNYLYRSATIMIAGFSILFLQIPRLIN